MDLLKRLTIKSLMLNKKRSIVTIIGIILSVALITAVASMYFSAINSLIDFEINQKGDYHISFLNVDSKDIKNFENNKDIEKVYITQDLGYSVLKDSQNEYKPYAFVKKYTKSAMENLGINLVEGRFPENENEILIPTHLKTNGRIKLEVGDEIVLDVGKRVDSDGYELTQDDAYISDDEENVGKNLYTSKTNQEQIIDTTKYKYKIVGICERPSSEIENYSAPGYTFITFLDDNNILGKVDIFSKYKKLSLKYESKITSNILGIDEDVYNRVVHGRSIGKIYTSEDIDRDNEEYNKSKYEIKVNGYLIELETNPISQDGGLSTVVAIICGIIIVTSVFCIKNSFDISITEKIKQYGMLRSVGATKKQIKKTVYFEAFVLGVIGIPLGILAGFLASYILIIVSNKLLFTSLVEGLKLVFAFSWMAVGISIILGIITIWLSSIRSARKASKITPILAIRNSGNIKIKAKKLKTPKYISKIFGIGGEISYKNLKRNRKKYRTTSISIVISVSIFIAIYYFSTLVVQSFKNEIGMQDYNISVYVKEYQNNKDNIDKILDLDNINQITIMRAKYVTIENIKFEDKYYKNIKSQYVDEEEISKMCNIFAVGENTYKNYIKKLGLNYEEVKNKAIIYNFSEIVVNDDDKVQTQKVPVYNYKLGEKIQFSSQEDGREIKDSIEIAKITDICPFGIYNGIQAIIVSDEYFDEIDKYNIYNNQAHIFIDSSDADKLQDDIEKLFEDKEISINNNAESIEMMQNMFILIAIFVYGFIIVVSLIGVTNIFNTITTSMELRRSDFASLRSIGMTDKEFSRMIRLESIFLCGRSLIIGLPIGIGLSYFINRYFVKSFQEIIPYKLPIIAILIASFVVFVLITIIMKYSLVKIKKQNIIETIRNENI